MDTDNEQESPRSAGGTSPGIVRGGSTHPVPAWQRALTPTVTGVLVAAAHASTTRLDGWPASGGAGDTPLPDIVLDSAANLLVGVPWPWRHGVLTLTGAALAMACLAAATRRRGLPPVAAMLVALVAATAPFAWTHAVATSGSVLILPASALLALIATRRDATAHPLTVATALAAAVSALAVTAALDVPSPWATFRGVAAELGGPGLVLFAVALTTRAALLPAAALVTAGAVTAWLGPGAQMAAMVPWAWMLVADGMSVLRDWRAVGARGADRVRPAWLVAGLAAWLVVSAASRDWRVRADVADTQHSWARATAAAAGDLPLVAAGRSPAAVRIGAWQRHLAGTADNHDVRDGALVLPDAAADARWTGAALATTPAALATVADVLTGLPRDAIVVVAVAGDAVKALAPEDWQALGRIGARPSTGRPQPRVIAGVTGGRLLGQERTGEDEASLVLLPGDLVVPTDIPSPAELHVEAGPRHVVLRERGRIRATGEDLLVAAYRRDGRLLATWTGAGGRWLGAGLPGEAGPPVARLVGTLPCRDVEAHRPMPLDGLSEGGALGLTAPVGTRMTIETAWATTRRPAPPRVVAGDAHLDEASGSQVELVATGRSPLGIDLRGRPDGVRLRASATVRACAAAPVDALPRVAAGRPATLDPADDTAFARGWHASEPGAGGRAFRWTDGPRAVLLVHVVEPPDQGTFALSLDALSAGEPGPADEIRLFVNGQPAGTRRLLKGPVTYRWDLPRALLTPGLNELSLETTLAVRPADVTPGADGRLLGLAVHRARMHQH